MIDTDGDDDGRPVVPADRMTEEERAAHWRKVNHAPGVKRVDFYHMDEDQTRRFLEGLR